MKTKLPVWPAALLLLLLAPAHASAQSIIYVYGQQHLHQPAPGTSV